MPTIIATSEDIRGLIPIIDAKKKSGYNVLAGNNFAFDADGPKSSFGNSFLTDVAQAGVKNAQSLRTESLDGTQNFWALDDRIVQWVESAGTFINIFVFPSTSTSPFRWTIGSVNRVTFFCHPAVGVLFFGVTTGQRGFVPLSGTLLEGEVIQALTENNGRLCLVSKTRFINSAQDNGFNYDFDVVGGASFLVLSAQVQGSGVMIASYKEGVMSFTDGGIMRSQFVGGQQVYQHRALKGDHLAINSFCVSLDERDDIVFLDRRGVYETSGDRPDARTPLFNEFLLEELERGTFQFNNNVRIEWGVNSQQFYIMFAESDQSGIYNYAFTLNSKLDKWGSFNEPSFAIGPILIDSGTRRGNFTGYIATDGRFRVFELASSQKDKSTDPSAYQYIPLSQSPKVLDSQATSIIAGSTMRLSSLAEATQGGISGLYNFDLTAIIKPTTRGLDSFIRVGLIRFVEGFYADEMSEMQQYVVSSSVGEAVDADNEDWDAVPSGTEDEDWNIEIGVVDWGFAPRTVVNFDFTAIGTVDGQTEFARVTPLLHIAKPATRYYWGQVVGIWHILEFAANTVGQFYHLRQVQLNGVSRGRFI